ncbi:MAG: 3'-5' exonuclease [Candidatus Pacebacteria bacterium]|nr:3'-5' exonuclease [Candidatus Paceibacterota bacterium]
MYLFFDTETTGLPKKWDAPVSDLENWPRLVQIAWLYFDENGNEISNKSEIIKPEGFTIPEEASNVHGISTKSAMEKGIDLKEVLKEFSNIMGKTKFLIAHNMSFDEKIIDAEFIRKGIGKSLFSPEKICTKEASTQYCEIPGNYGYKWPSLSELHIKLFGSDFDDAHDALVDVKACAKCFFELKKRGVILFK